MKNITKDLIQVAKIAVIAFILSVGVSYVFADWTPPQNTPPTCPTGQAGCDAPIHVGAAGQTKRGNFIIESLNSAGQVLANALVILNGKVGIGVANPTTKLQVSSSGADGILLSRDTNTTSPGVYSGRLFFQNDTTAFSLMAVRDAFEFRYGANPGTSSGVVGMYLDNAGKLTVGTTTEIVTRLDVIGRIQIRDGTQGAGKVLTSDAYGIASWTPPLTGGPGASSNIVITEFGPYRSLSKTSLGIQTYCALSNIATSRENHGARVWKEGNEWFTASINEIDAIPGYGDSRIQSFRVTCFKGDIIQGTSSGVTKIIAGTNVTVSPSNGIGDVTINASGGSGSSTPATTCADLGGTWDGTKCNGLGGGAVTISHLGPFFSPGAGSPKTVNLGVHTYCALSQYTSTDDNHVGEVTQNTTTKVWTLSHQKVNKIAVVCFDGVVSGGSGSTGTAGVTKINAGTGISVSPTTGTGEVTVTATGSSVAGAVSIGGGGWEGSTNSVSCVTSCEPWGGATCSGSNATCNKFIQCPSGYNKVMTGDYQGISDLPSHHNPFRFTSVDRGASFTCYK